MHKQTEKDKKFLETMNAELRPVLEIVQQEDRTMPHFELELCETKYAAKDQVVVNWRVFESFVKKCGIDIYGVEPKFNNTGRIFWF